MRLCRNTDVLAHLAYEEMLETAAEIGIESMEIACGNWSASHHINLDKMLTSADARNKFIQSMKTHGLMLEALNCSGNQLEPNDTGKDHQTVVEKTFQLAEMLGVEKL